MAEYIERETAIEIIDNYGKTISKDCIAVYQAIRDIVDVICPVADVVEVKHGHWVRNAPNPEAMRTLHKAGIAKAMSENSIYWTCSCCNEWGHPYDKYCSNCGAKMDGEKNG